MDEIGALKDAHLKEVNPAFKPQVGNSLLTEKACQMQRAQIAKEKGEAWLLSRSNTPFAYINSCERVSNQWDDDNIALVLEDVRHFKDLEDLDTFNAEDLGVL